jgi:hypothetical protein
MSKTPAPVGARLMRSSLGLAGDTDRRPAATVTVRFANESRGYCAIDREFVDRGVHGIDINTR